MVPVAGVEPALPFRNGILSPARLPVPSHRQDVIVECNTLYNGAAGISSKKIVQKGKSAGKMRLFRQL